MGLRRVSRIPGERPKTCTRGCRVSVVTVLLGKNPNLKESGTEDGITKLRVFSFKRGNKIFEYTNLSQVCLLDPDIGIKIDISWKTGHYIIHVHGSPHKYKPPGKMGNVLLCLGLFVRELWNNPGISVNDYVGSRPCTK